MFGRQPPVQRLRPAGGGFSCEIPSMRKHTINTSEPNPPRTSEEWLNLEKLLRWKFLLKIPNIQSNRHSCAGNVLVGVLANQVSRRFGSYLMSQQTFDGYGSGFRSYRLSERSSLACAGPIAKPVLAERSFDSNGTLIPEVRQSRWKITKSTCITS